MDRFTELELFFQIAEGGSMSRAAEVLGLSNPAASRYLSALENRLHTRLVERNTRRRYLTAEGQAFYESARGAVSELQDAEAALQTQKLNPSGVLRVSASLSFALHQIAPRLRNYPQLYPNVRVHL